MIKSDWFVSFVYFLMIICGFLSGLAGHLRVGLILFVLAVIIFYGGKAWRIIKGDKRTNTGGRSAL